MPDETAERRPVLRELALLFLRLGVTSFGGPAAHVAMMEDEVVRRRGWLARADFLDLVGATNLIPGPNSTELAIHIGRLRAGWAGLVVAGACFILPAAFIVAAFAWGYVRFGGVPAVVGVLAGVKPVVIAVVLQALWGLGGTALRTRWLAAVGAASLVATLVGIHELAVLALAACAGALSAGRGAGGGGATVARAAAGAALLPPVAMVGAGAALAASATPAALFLVFARIGAVLFGSGYVLLAFLRADLVERLGWLSERQLLDAVAIGQVTPGPLFTTATFVGWLVAGAGGAAAATLGIFLPAFVFVAASAPLLPRIRRSRVASAMLDAVNAASLALMAHVSWQLARAAVVDWLSLGIALASAWLLFARRVNSAWLVLGGGALAVAASLLRNG